MKAKTKEKTDSEVYQKLSQKEHILKRPDMYLGSINNVEEEKWVIEKNENENENQTSLDNESTVSSQKNSINTNLIVNRKLVKYNKGLEQCVVELITNAVDHARRTLVQNVDLVTRIDINLTKDSFSIKNNGKGIPITIHDKEKIYIPEMIFGHLNTGSNYGDDDKRTWGGKNGVGSKAVNVFSKKFTIEIQSDNKNYVQTFENNLEIVNPPIITNRKCKDYTQITFEPDFKRFGVKSFFDDDNVLVIKKRTYDASACTNKKVSVYFNGEKIEIKEFKDYVNLYSKGSKKIIYEDSNGRWNVAFSLNPYDYPVQVSFVNGLYTEQGGSHVKHITDQVVSKVQEIIEDSREVKKEQLTIKPSYIKDNLIFYVNSLIDNPSFSSQTKDKLDTKVSDFGSSCKIPDDIIKKISKLGIVENILEKAHSLNAKQLDKKLATSTRSRLTGIPKLQDAAQAGKKEAHKCTLILTEGDSASGTARTGVTIAGNQYWGIFPLKGKVLNVSKATISALRNNDEIINITKILGLSLDNPSINNLRYGRVMIMADQDSVSNDTPLILRQNNKIMIKTIEDLFNDFLEENNKEKIEGLFEEKERLIVENIEIWSDKGFTKIKYVMRHKTNKRMFRVRTKHCSIDVTEDHSLLDENGKEISPVDCKVGQKLLTKNLSNDVFNQNNYKISDYSNSEELMYVLGVLYSFDDYSKIKFNDKSLREKFFNIVEKNNYDIDDLIKRYLKNGVLSEFVLNSEELLRLKFINGYIESSDTQNNIDNMISKIKLQCLDYMFSSVNQKNREISDYETIEVIEELESSESSKFVYDVETENHHFQAGIGALIVHNTDGFHIKGLLMNYFTKYWPDLCGKNFITSLLTPIVKVTIDKEVISFYNLYDFNKFMETAKDKGTWKKCTVKYYKGLGTSTKKEAIEYFKDIDKNMINYTYDKNGKEDDKALSLAFDDKRSDDRKEWITNALGNISKLEVDYKKKNVPVSDFIHNELVQFSIYDNMRSLPNMIDGLKISQRKILYGSYLEKIPKEGVKVATLASSISKKTDYHHGENSLYEAIINMAQDFVGTGNLPIFEPIGQFGSRFDGGKDAASPRYIFTALKKWVPIVYNELDYELLEYNYNDNEKIEPKMYVPIIPMILANGSEGIGTGWSCYVPCYKPSSIIENIRRMLDDKEPLRMLPWYRGFKGEIIETVKDTKWITKGVYSKTGNTIRVTELPIGYWTSKFIEEVLDKEELVKNYENKNDIFSSQEKNKNLKKKKNDVDDALEKTNCVDFEITLNNSMTDEEIIKNFKLETSLKGGNMVGFNNNGVVHRYQDTIEILKEFYKIRLFYYEKRKDYLLKELELQIIEKSEIIRFIELVISEKIIVFKKRKSEIIESIKNNDFKVIDDDQEFKHLLKLHIDSFSQDLIDKFNNQLLELRNEYDNLKKKSSKDLWRIDLDKLEQFEEFRV